MANEEQQHGSAVVMSGESSSSSGSALATTLATGQMNPQFDSRFFSVLPQEIRDKIYALWFRGKRLRRGTRRYDFDGYVKMLPDGTTLDLLRVCRRLRAEVGDSWIGQIMWYYEDIRTMLDHLTTHSWIVPKIRHLRAPADPIRIEAGERAVNYRLAPALRLLHGLQLDTLYVIGCEAPEVSYETITSLVRDSWGWRELRFISHSSNILGFARLILSMQRGDEEEMRKWWRRPQPATWLAHLEDRDGVESGATCAVYRSPLPYSSFSILDPVNQIPHVNEMPADTDALNEFGHQEVDAYMRGVESHHEVLVVATRGRGIDIEERPDRPQLHQDFSRGFPGWSWRQIRRGRGGVALPQPTATRAHRDTYNHWEEFIWKITKLTGIYQYKDPSLDEEEDLNPAELAALPPLPPMNIGRQAGPQRPFVVHLAAR